MAKLTLTFGIDSITMTENSSVDLQHQEGHHAFGTPNYADTVKLEGLKVNLEFEQSEQEVLAGLSTIRRIYLGLAKLIARHFAREQAATPKRTENREQTQPV